MAEARTLYTKETAPKSARGRFNPKRHFRNRAAFSKLRRSLRAHHFSTLREARRSPVWSDNGASKGQVKVSIEEINNGVQHLQTVSISDGGKLDEIMCIEHPPALSKAWGFIKSLPLFAIIGGTFFGCLNTMLSVTKSEFLSHMALNASRAFLGKADFPSVFLTGAIAGTALTVALSLRSAIRSITSHHINPDLYSFVKNGSGRAISALVQHLEERGFPSRISESETRNGQA